ncbi:MAG TPA: GNAT family N-acetyltransferase [Levilinea sp.]|nr:GNAT family N-acetyltransferase [Levilinea sp.]
MQILPFHAEHLPSAAGLFARSFKQQRQAVPALPARLESPAEVEVHLKRMLEKHTGVAAVQDGELVGYVIWLYIENFRNARRKAAYCPVLAHAANPVQQDAIIRALYRCAAAQWAEAGCEVHAVSLLAFDQAAIRTWFWSGFGLAVVDAVRLATPLNIELPRDVVVRKAHPADADMLADLEAEHWQHYLAAPVFMNPTPPSTASEFVELLGRPGGSGWLAFASDHPVGYLRLEASSSGASEVVSAATTISITGAYVQPQARGRGVAAALLDAALRDDAARGYTACSVDFESFNPEAARFWMRHFKPVCYSLLRVPER